MDSGSNHGSPVATEPRPNRRGEVETALASGVIEQSLFSKFKKVKKSQSQKSKSKKSNQQISESPKKSICPDPTFLTFVRLLFDFFCTFLTFFTFS